MGAWLHSESVREIAINLLDITELRVPLEKNTQLTTLNWFAVLIKN